MTTFVEFHVLQSFPVCNLNRDELGTPKSCVYGGVTRSRISSQCLKRQVRMKMRDLGVELGIRTRAVDIALTKMLTERNPDIAAEAIAECVAKVISTLKFDNLTMLSSSEYEEIAEFVEKTAFDPEKIVKKEMDKFNKAFRKVGGGHCGLDIALFGRMIATLTSFNVEAACSVAHAITTHAITSGIDYFTAVDDKDGKAAYLDNNGFTAGVFYRYAVLNVDRLVETLGLNKEELEEAVKVFVEALYLAVPSGKQSSMTAWNYWDYAHVVVRTGQPVQANFEKPVEGTSFSGLLEPSIKRLEESLARTEHLMGSFAGKQTEFVFGTEQSLPIDKFAEEVARSVRNVGME